MTEGSQECNAQRVRPAPRGAFARLLAEPPLRVVRSSCVVLCSALSLFGCRSTPKRTVEAQFGLFFGGQIQQRSVLSIDTNASVQPLGFRLLFEAPVTHPTDIEWTLDFPAAKAGPRGPSNVPRGERTDRVVLPKGAEQFEQLVRLRSTDVPGTYNVRIKVDADTVLDRPFRLTWSRGEDE